MADRLREIDKFVVATGPADPPWPHTTVLRGDPVTTVANLKRQVDGEIVVPASFRLVRTLLAADLVDELRLIVYPFLLGRGDTGFGSLAADRQLLLIDQQRLGEHLTCVTYRIDRPSGRPAPR